MDFNLAEVLFNGQVLAFLGAAIAVIFSAFGSAKGVGMCGEAGAGLVTEEPEKFGKIIVLEVLPATQGLYGFVIAFVIILKLGVFGGDLAAVTSEQGFMFLFASLPTALVGWVSAIHQGRVAACGINILAKREEELSKAIILAAMVETFAIFAFLASFLLIWFGISL